MTTSSQTWADILSLPKPEEIFRYIFQNIQGLPVNPRGHKHIQISTAIHDTEADVFGLAELNLNFKTLSPASQWSERFRHLRRNHSVHTYNRHDSSRSNLLYGGTAQIATGACSHRALSSGADNSGMGRWVWTLFTGKNNTRLRVISGYRPNPDTQDKAGSVYSQQERRLRDLKDDRNPRRAFIKDLEKQLEVWIQAGNLLIIGLDANDNVRTGDVNTMLRTKGLIDIHRAQHPHLLPEATCNKNTKAVPVDGIWASPSLHCTAAGYYGFGELVIGKTDHRMIWADFSYESALGFQPPKPSYSAPQRLTLQDPRVVKRYNKVLKAEHRRLHLNKQAFALQTAVPSGLLSTHHRTYATLAHLDKCARKHANKKCRKLRMGKQDYSVAFHTARSAVDMWDLLIRKRNGVPCSCKKIRRLMHLTNEMTALRLPLRSIIVKRKAAMSNYKKLKKSSDQERVKFGRQLIKARAKAKHTTVAAQETQLKNAFGQRQLAQRVKRLSGKQRGDPLRSVTAPDPITPSIRTECHDKLSIEQAFIEEGTRRFSQTNGTPLMQPDFISRVGYLAELPGADEILDGTFQPAPDMDPYAVKFLEQLKMQPAVRDAAPLSRAISTASYRESWQKMKPTTSSSPYGPTFVHYIAGSQDPEIAEFDATMANIPYASGHSPEAWTKMVDVLIPKKTSSAAIEKLRIIVLFHALFNMNNKRIGRDMIANAERLNQIPWEAYGSRKRHRSIECAANKVFTTDIARQEHRPMALCSNDAKSCYDRILHAIASICMRRVGVHKNTCLMMFGTLAKVKHYIRTTYGDSSNAYSCIEVPFQGVYQGNGAGPGIWLLVSIPIINMLKSAGFGFTVRTVISGDEFSFVCYTFVDDSDVVHSSDGDNDSDTSDLVAEMQEVVDTWEGGLRASGGALVPTKSYWFLISFIFERNRWRYARLEECPGVISIRDIDGLSRVELERLDIHEAKETLGVWIAMDGNQHAQTQALIALANLWADRVRTGKFSPAEAWYSLQYCIMKSLEYPLMATSMSKKQCDDIMKPIRSAALSALGSNRHLSLVVVHGPQRYQGMGIPDLWTVQGILKLWITIQHGDALTITGHQLRASMELHTLEIGLPGNLLQQDYSIYGQLATNSWLKHLWEFCADSNIQVTTTTPQLSLARTNDEFLMLQFANYGYRDTELSQLNLCRLHCHATRLSDITTGDGRRIHPMSWAGYPTESAGREYEWPTHGRPTNALWTLWQSALRQCFLTLETPQQYLRRPLGTWTGPIPAHWHWFYSRSNDRVYHFSPDDNHYDTYSVLPNRKTLRSPKYFATTTTTELPKDAQRTTVTEHPNFVWSHGSQPSSYTEPTPPLALEDLITDNDKWAVSHLDYSENGQHLAQALIRGSAIAVCDGSYKQHFGTAAFVLQNGNNHDHRIVGAHVTPGHPDDINPYRSELGGILALIIIVDAIATFHDIEQGIIELGCDCESGLTSIFTHTYDTPKQPHHDIIHEIRQKLAVSKITWKHRHVAGHQDKHVPVNLLDMWGQLNVEMDSLAKVYWNETSATTIPFYPHSSFGWSLWIGPRKLSSWNRQELYNHARSPAILKHWSQRRNLPIDLIHSIDWESCQEAIKKLGLNRSLWVPKWLAGFAPVGKVLQRNQQQDHAECPRCAAFESTEHVLLCPAPKAQQTWDSSIATLTTWLIKIQTMPDLHHAILAGIQAWRQQALSPIPSYAWPGVNDIVLRQTRLGWRAFLEGAILCDWAAKQQEYYEWIQRQNTGKRWITSLIKLLWELSWNMWDQRNGELHNPESPATLREHARLDALIAAECSDQLTLFKKDRRWFCRPREVLFTETIAYKQQWLESVSLARARYARRRRTSTQAQRDLMRTTFPPPRIPLPAQPL